MKDVKFYLRGHARSDIAKIRQYTINNWGKEQWQAYKTSLFKKLQTLANNPEIGMIIEEISPNSFRFPLKEHVIYYYKKDEKIIFVGIISSEMSPEKHLIRKQDISSELGC
jgi:toxin ParE1/3/4